MALSGTPSDRIIDPYRIPHAQGHETDGYQFLAEDHNLIFAIMRGSEAMALSISDMPPLAKFLHAFRPDDIKDHHMSSNR